MNRLLLIIVFLVIVTSGSYAQEGIDTSEDFEHPVSLYHGKDPSEAEIKIALSEAFADLSSFVDGHLHIFLYGPVESVKSMERQILDNFSTNSFHHQLLTIYHGGSGETGLNIWVTFSARKSDKAAFSSVAEQNQLTEAADLTSKTAAQEKALIVENKRVRTGLFESFGTVSDRFFNWVFKDFSDVLEANKDVKGYILVYGTEPERSRQLDRIVRLEPVQRMSTDRLIVIDGGPKKKFVTELWILPEESAPPKL